MSRNNSQPTLGLPDPLLACLPLTPTLTLTRTPNQRSFRGKKKRIEKKEVLRNVLPVPPKSENTLGSNDHPSLGSLCWAVDFSLLLSK